MFSFNPDVIDFNTTVVNPEASLQQVNAENNDDHAINWEYQQQIRYYP